VPQGHDGVHPGGLAGRIAAEEEVHQQRYTGDQSQNEIEAVLGLARLKLIRSTSSPPCKCELHHKIDVNFAIASIPFHDKLNITIPTHVEIGTNKSCKYSSIICSSMSTRSMA
jgi:hypothetical protein